MIYLHLIRFNVMFAAYSNFISRLNILWFVAHTLNLILFLFFQLDLIYFDKHLMHY